MRFSSFVFASSRLLVLAVTVLTGDAAPSDAMSSNQITNDRPKKAGRANFFGSLVATPQKVAGVDREWFCKKPGLKCRVAHESVCLQSGLCTDNNVGSLLALAAADDPNYWRTVYDAYNDREVRVGRGDAVLRWWCTPLKSDYLNHPLKILRRPSFLTGGPHRPRP